MIGVPFYIGQAVGRNEVLKGEELFAQVDAHRALVVFGVMEIEWRTGEADGAVVLGEPVTCPGKGIDVTAERGDACGLGPRRSSCRWVCGRTTGHRRSRLR